MARVEGATGLQARGRDRWARDGIRADLRPFLALTTVALAMLAACAPASKPVPTSVPSVLEGGNPRGSLLYENFIHASEVLDRAMVAHGGAELVDRSVNFRFSFTGTLRYEGHYERPGASKDYPFEETTAYSADVRAVRSSQTFGDDDEPTLYFTIVGPANGLEREAGAKAPVAIAEADLGRSLSAELELLPQEYLRQARAGVAGLRMLPGSGGYEVLAYTLENGEGRALFFAEDTHLLMRVERIGHWKHKGDRLGWRTFGDHEDRNGIQVPRHSVVHVEESSTQYEVSTELGALELGVALDADAFVVPEASRAGFEDWKLEERKAEDPLEPLPSHDLGNGAWVIELPPSDARSLLVAFSDFSVVVEAGDYSEISARILATADRLLPDKPVRYVAMTHHHPLYAGGLRPYVQRGVTVLVTPGNVDYYRDLVTRPYRIHPDEQQRKPREPKLEVIDGTRVIADGTRRLELYEFDYSTHTDEYVLPYLPSHKLIVTADMVYVLRDEALRPASVRTLAIDRVVKEHGLDVLNVMQTWFLSRSEHLVPYSVVEEQIRLAKEKEAKR